MGTRGFQEIPQKVSVILVMFRKGIRDIPSRARNFPSLEILLENPLKQKIS